MTAIALSFAVGVLAFPEHPFYATRYPLAVQLAWVLIPVSILGIVCLNMRVRAGRIGTSIAAFMCWGLLALGSVGEFADLSTRYAIMFAIFSVIELGIFVRLHLRMEELRDTLDAAVIANNTQVELTGHAPSPGGHEDGGPAEKRP